MYAVARRRQRTVQLAYRVYVTESLRYAPQGMALQRGFLDAITPRQDFDASEIIDRVASALADG